MSTRIAPPRRHPASIRGTDRADVRRSASRPRCADAASRCPRRAGPDWPAPAPRGTAAPPDSPARCCSADARRKPSPSRRPRRRSAAGSGSPGVPVPARASVRPMWSITTGRPIASRIGIVSGRSLHVDPELQVPAEVLHHRRELLRVLERDAAAVVQLPAAEEMIEAQRPHAELVPAAQLGRRHGLVGHRDAAQPVGVRASASSIAELSRPCALPCTSTPRSKPSVSSMCEILLQRRVGRRVAAVAA